MGTLLNFVRGLVNSLFAHWADFFAETGEIGVVSGLTVLPTQVWLFASSFLPVLVVLRLTPSFFFELGNGIAPWVLAGFVACQKLLAALGIAISLSLIMRGSSLAYLVLGWLAAWVMGPVAGTLLGGSIAAIHAYLARKRRDAKTAPDAADNLIPDALPDDNEADEMESPQSLSAVHLSATFVLWAFFHEAAQNFQRFQHMGFATALSPIGRRLWGTLATRAAFLRRHLSLFNAEWVLGSYAVGAAAALEERKANGDAISDGEFAGAKTSIMASLDAIGNALVGGVLTALCVAVGTRLAQQFGVLGPVVFFLMQSVAVLGLALFCFQLGYRQTRYWATWARANDWLRAGLFGAMRLGTFVLGMLILVYADVRLPANATIAIGEAVIPLANIVNGIAPRWLPLLLVLWLWWQLRTQRTQPLGLFVVCVVLAFVGCWVLWQVGWLS
jgi:mannose/fructose/N-acetylgalactosamine-specific phosphotransferase system component IID